MAGGSGAQARGKRRRGRRGRRRAGGFLGSLFGLSGRMVRHMGAGPGRPHPPRARRDPPRGASYAPGLIVFIASLRLDLRFAGSPVYLIAWGGWIVAFAAYLALECVSLARRGQAHTRREDPDEAERNGAACRLDRGGQPVRRPGLSK